MDPGELLQSRVFCLILLCVLVNPTEQKATYVFGVATVHELGDCAYKLSLFLSNSNVLPKLHALAGGSFCVCDYYMGIVSYLDTVD